MVRVAIALTVLLVLAPVGSFFAWRYVQASAIRSDIEYARGEMEDLSRPFKATLAQFRRADREISLMAKGWSSESVYFGNGFCLDSAASRWFGDLPAAGPSSWLRQLWRWQAAFGGAVLVSTALAVAWVRRPVGWQGVGAAVAAATIRVVMAGAILVPVTAQLVLSPLISGQELIGTVSFGGREWLGPVPWPSVRFIGVLGAMWGVVGAARAISQSWRLKCFVERVCTECGYPRSGDDEWLRCSECGFVPASRERAPWLRRLTRSPDASVALVIVASLASGFVVASTDTFFGRWLSRERPAARSRWTQLHFLPGQGVLVEFFEGTRLCFIEEVKAGDYTPRITWSFSERDERSLKKVPEWEPPVAPIVQAEGGWWLFPFGEGRYCEMRKVRPDEPGGALVMRVLDAVAIDRWKAEDFRGPPPPRPPEGYGLIQHHELTQPLPGR